MAVEHFDVIIVGAGLSGIGAAWHLQDKCPGKTYTILEGRDAIGGTWDLFRYPGIRSDSDMYTLGYSFKPWTGEKAIADGASIREYVRETAREYGIDRNIRFGHRVTRTAWSTDDACWTIEAKTGARGRKVTLTCNFLVMASGYYRYDQGYTPEFAGREDFKGRIIHPQHWPEDLDYAGKRIVVIGSGATAMTLIPNLTDKAEHVVMLQRSPTYVMSLPDKDPIAGRLRRLLPEELAYKAVRAKNVGLSMFFYELSRRAPEAVKKIIRTQQEHMLGRSVDIDTHFRPSYKPWDQRLCLVPNGDLYKALRKGKASVETDHIDRFTETGIRLRSGKELPCDIIVTATGLELATFGGATMMVDGREVNPGEHFSYKGMMLDDVPNMVSIIGYTNASWTLKADLTSGYMCRLLNHMDRHGYDYCLPHNSQPVEDPSPLLDLTAGYVQRAIDKFPKQGAKAPWRVYQNYLLDLLNMRFAPVADRHMQFRRKSTAARTTPQRLAS